jgi:hypothetical protein
MKETIGNKEPTLIGNLPVIKVASIINRIPVGKWELPNPNEDLRLKTDDLMIVKKYKKEIFGLRCDKIFGDMISFCDSAQMAFNAENNLKEKNQGEDNYQNLVNLRTFRNILGSKTDKKKDLGDLINSCRKGFAFLMGKNARKRMGIKMLPRLDNEDIKNTRILVKGLVKRLVIK